MAKIRIGEENFFIRGPAERAGSDPGLRWQVILVALAALAAFAPGLGTEAFGDDLKILGQRLAGLTLHGLPALLGQNWWGDLVPVARHYRPLALLLLGLERLAFGDHTALYRLVGLALHIACCLQVRRVVAALGFREIALAAALLFAVHPVHAEAVLGAYGQADLLAALGVLVALERWCAWAEGGSRRALLASYAAFFLGLCSKESGVVLPALVVFARGVVVRRDARGLARWVTPAELGYALPFLIYLAARAATLQSLLPPSEVTVSGNYPLWLRLQLVPVALAHDIGLVVAPIGQAIYHGEVARRLHGSVLPEMIGLGLALVALSAATRAMSPRLVLFAAGWFALTVAPVADVIPLPVLVSERNLYLPALAPALLAAGLWRALRAQPGLRRRIADAALVALAVVGLVASWRVVYEWRTPVSMWTAAARRSPDDPQIRIWLGAAHLGQARSDPAHPDLAARDAARADFDAALRLDPSSSKARVGRAAVAVLDDDCATVVRLLSGVDTSAPEDHWIADGLAACRQRLRESGHGPSR